MGAKISDVLRKEGHPGYAIDVAALENLVVKLRNDLEAMTARAAINGKIAMRYQDALEYVRDYSNDPGVVQRAKDELGAA
jgi:hypothetical protein